MLIITPQWWNCKTILYSVTVPNEVKLMKKEYFNRWYGLTSFYLAFTLSKLPGLVS